MAPVFDLNLSMLPYVTAQEFNNIGDKLFDYAPKLGSDFTRLGQLAVKDVIRDRLKDVRDFRFHFRGDEKFPAERIRALEDIIQQQAKAILSPQKLYTQDVFVSQRAIELEKRRSEVQTATALLQEFSKQVRDDEFSDQSLTSICADDNAAEFLLENGSYLVTVDFVAHTCLLQHNAQKVSLNELQQVNPDFFNDVSLLLDKLDAFSKAHNDCLIKPPAKVITLNAIPEACVGENRKNRHETVDPGSGDDGINI
jgi:hypothetical protein